MPPADDRQRAAHRGGPLPGQTFGVPLLTDDEFKATMGHPMRAVTEVRALPSAFWDYVDEIPLADFQGTPEGDLAVEHAYADPSERWHHISLSTAKPDIFMVVVLDVEANAVLGHHLLDLPTLYGLRDQ